MLYLKLFWAACGENDPDSNIAMTPAKDGSVVEKDEDVDYEVFGASYSILRDQTI